MGERGRPAEQQLQLWLKWIILRCFNRAQIAAQSFGSFGIYVQVQNKGFNHSLLISFTIILQNRFANPLPKTAKNEVNHRK